MKPENVSDAVDNITDITTIKDLFTEDAWITLLDFKDEKEAVHTRFLTFGHIHSGAYKQRRTY